MSKKDNQIKRLLKALAERPIAYQRIYAQIAGSVTAGLLFSQLFYWWDAVGEREFFKTDKDLCEELAMGLYELKTAKAKLKSLGLVDFKRKGRPCKTYYKIDKSALLAQISSYRETPQPIISSNPQLCGKPTTKLCGKPTTKLCGKPTTNITDNTSESTSDKQEVSSETGISSNESRQQTAMSLLLSRGVVEKVARSIVYEQHTPLESIEETIKNGLAKQKHAEQTGGDFRLEPGYIVKVINQARSEGKVVGATKLSKKLSANLKIPKTKYTPLSQKEFEQRKKQQLQQLVRTG